MLSLIRRVALPLSLGCIAVVCTAGSAAAQKWAAEMFADSKHDFGIVPRGAKTEYRFEFTNKYEQPLHIADVRTSCGCTSPRFEKADVKTYEKSAIICEFNTRAFVGYKSAVITVVIDRPSYAEVQLQVEGNIRSDIVTEPGEIQFGALQPGQEKSQTVRISYAGRNAWEIKDVLSENSNLGVSFAANSPTRTRDGRVEYIMNVRLKDTTPVGDLNDQIILKTNESQYNLVAIPVRGRVLPPLEVTPPNAIGTMKTGTTWTGRIVVKAKEPFTVTNVDCEDSRIAVSAPEGKKVLHVIPIKFAAGDKVGAFRQKITIKTDLPKDGVTHTSLMGNIVE
ncbi:MAG TPA: hypothetical protein DDW52_01960 [Planctomycetaceae bacterium]|nr:hypothetical protein [Planctomycetaceae bacterium]